MEVSYDTCNILEVVFEVAGFQLRERWKIG
jgi:hypothetical protein